MNEWVDKSCQIDSADGNKLGKDDSVGKADDVLRKVNAKIRA